MSLCSGGGGLDRGIHLACGNAKCVCCVEHEAYAVEVLASQMENGYLDDAPIWTDLRSFDGKPWRGVVDIIIGGYPCQPFSVAGKRAGTDDPRHLWPEVARIVSEVEPQLVFLENVPGHLILGFEAVRDELQGLGYSVAAGLFSAEEVGAPHKRERLFILGYRDEPRSQGRLGERTGKLPTGSSIRELANTGAAPVQQEAAGSPNDSGRITAACASRTVGDSTSVRQCCSGDLTRADRSDRRRLQEPERGSGALADACCIERAARPAIGRIACESGSAGNGRVEPTKYCSVFPPAPNDREGWMRLLEIDPSLEPAVCVCSDGMADRADQLRVLGNGVVPLVAGYAFLSLYACLREGK